MKTYGYVISAMLAASPWGNAIAQQYPTKPVRMLVGFAPGGGTDIVARIICAKLTEIYGQGFVVDNRAGATGTIAADLMSKAGPDGYTIMMGHVNSHGIAPNLFKKLPYDAQRDFAMVSYVGYVPNVLVIHPSIPAKTVAELVTIAKAKPASLNYASSGVGTPLNLAGELIKQQGKVNITHVPFRGGAQAVPEVLAGRLKLEAWDESVEQWITRVNRLAEWFPELEVNPLTEADRASEALIRSLLTAARPDDGILGDVVGESDAGGACVDGDDGARAEVLDQRDPGGACGGVAECFGELQVVGPHAQAHRGVFFSVGKTSRGTGEVSSPGLADVSLKRSPAMGCGFDPCR